MLALALASLIRNQLFGVNPHDPWTLLGASFSLAIAAGLAGFVPAVRASSVDPMRALRRNDSALDMRRGPQEVALELLRASAAVSDELG